MLYDRLFNCACERVKEMQSRSQLGNNFSQAACQGCGGFSLLKSIGNREAC